MMLEVVLSDWQNTQVTGYWFLDAAADWTPPAALMKFLNSGKPPVYIGFGSMEDHQALVILCL